MKRRILAAAAVAGAAALLPWAVLHGRRDGPGWENIEGARYAHRGLHGPGAPENSMAAFRRAAEAGYGAELDVHLTRDGRLAVIHDADLTRMCGVPGLVEEQTAEELSALRLAGTEEPIPFLEEVLPLFAGKAPLIVELKTDRHNAAALARAVTDCLDRFAVDACVESFDPRPLLWLRISRPDVLRGQLSKDFHRDPGRQNAWNRLALTNLFYNVFSRPDFIAGQRQLSLPQIPQFLNQRRKQRRISLTDSNVRAGEPIGQDTEKPARRGYLSAQKAALLRTHGHKINGSPSVQKPRGPALPGGPLSLPCLHAEQAV